MSLFYKELDEKRNSLIDSLQKLENNDDEFEAFDLLLSMSAYYATPIRDHISFTRKFDAIKKEKTSLDTSYSLSIIKKMIGAEFKKDDKQDIRFYTPKVRINRFDIPLHLASSSARCLVDLYFYLKHLAQHGDLLIIDEPESHLTLRNQRLMAKLLASMVNIGIKVFITTHSDFLVKELNNFILLNNDFKEKNKWLKDNKSMYSQADSLDYKKVNVYQVVNGKVDQLITSRYGIEVPYFDNEITEIFKVANDLEYFID
ncbi:AAA family ATPase [Myroides sp. mNGS23_01]|nr:AAA family ATPase [Myroides sp. mNGS23_01]WHT40880.1 AAA family ATPase [Myroides sp. mNGS23_01]